MTSDMMQKENFREVVRCPDCGGPLIKVPVLQCTRCEIAHPLRAFTYRSREGHYIAECIDLDLLAQADTREEAIGKLQEAMFSYLALAFAEGESTRGLVLRPSPLSHRLRYMAHRFFPSLLAKITRSYSRSHFVLPNRVVGVHTSLSHY